MEQKPQDSKGHRTRSIAGLVVAMCAGLAGTLFADDALQHTGIWCVSQAEDGGCTSIYEMSDDNTFVSYNLNTQRQLRYDVFGKWLEKPGMACFVRESWLLIDLAEDVAVNSGELGMSTFYCNEIVEATHDKLVVTDPTDDKLITATRLSELPDWASQ